MQKRQNKKQILSKDSSPKQLADSGKTNLGVDNSKEIIKTIKDLPGELQTYPIRTLVEQAEIFGLYLKKQNLKTNQIRKFLDAINRLKFELSQGGKFSKIETAVIMLKPKLVYAANRANANKSQTEAIKKLGDVLSAAIDKLKKEVKTPEDLESFKEDFERLVQLIESIIAYHKAEGGE
ncbi:type III-A CRISPR-associated protein Csm2 [Lyngbya aestuarii]|uniref:type III-A CRISPR-associated protein Csm2 n=1 Tax=Lyngbya aestuarii TaxID=118322 RepID=UPI00403D7EBF